MSPDKAGKAGRGAAKVAALLRKKLGTGAFPVGQYLPGIRELARDLDVSPETVRRAMKHLETEHLVRTHARHGFKVTGMANDPARSAPIAYVCSDQPQDSWSGIPGMRLTALNACAGKRGWSVTGISAQGRTAEDVVGQLLAARASGIVLDSADERLHAAVAKLGVPTVMADTWLSGSPFDAVTQGNFGGAMQAAEYLVSRGHRRIGWVGPADPGIQGLERWAGALAGLRQHGLEMPARYMVEVRGGKVGPELRDLLAAVDRPTGLIAPWSSCSAEAVRTGMELGLTVGPEFEVVGWCPEESYEHYLSIFPANRTTPQVVWSVRDMAEACISRLAERRAHPELRITRLNIETRLRLPGTSTGESQ
ncbi:MAG TPA: GntR family transcriptional regulator [Planctomycetota bacterium]|nr:GntR family transcriptional regulator [Planctomycetota bacterium]